MLSFVYAGNDCMTSDWALIFDDIYISVTELIVDKGTHANLLTTAEDGETTYSSCDADQHAACCDPVSSGACCPCEKGLS